MATTAQATVPNTEHVALAHAPLLWHDQMSRAHPIGVQSDNNQNFDDCSGKTVALGVLVLFARHFESDKVADEFAVARRTVLRCSGRVEIVLLAVDGVVCLVVAVVRPMCAARAH